MHGQKTPGTSPCNHRGGRLMIYSIRLRYLLTLGYLVSLAVGQSPSGQLISGIRVLTWPNPDHSYRVYRGDYIKFRFTDGRTHVVQLPELNLVDTLRGDLEEDPFFKMKQTGVWSLRIDDQPGRIEVVPFTGSHYQEVDAQAARTLIHQIQPYLLDVRTEWEYQEGHLPDAHLIPVQILQQELDRLRDVQDSPILVYCHSGNRSTVASKILLDAGFQHIYNLSGGIRGWQQAGYPIVK
ncbi:MAG: rhodanese-like domain-containing protein [Candidatus Neomarinimicrobiota bacterium]|nr:MAG: rhodanese-like domain-containing protein [Candidatus Neomarinimicrobiota bacterium]